MKLLTLVLSIFTLASLTLAQTGFSESKPYEPKGDAKLEEKNRNPQTATSQEIVIPVSVLDKTLTPVTDLTKANFGVFVNGAETSVTSFEKASELPNIILLLDMSPSAGLRSETIRKQAEKFVEALPSGAKVMVAEFHSQMKIRTQLTSDRAEMLKGISKTKVDDGTSLYSAVHTLFQQVLPQVPGRKVIVLFTDGVDTTSTKSNYPKSLHVVENADVPVYVVFHDTFNDIPKNLGTLIGPAGRHFPLPPGLVRQGRGSAQKEYEIGREYLKDLVSATGARALPSDKFDSLIKSLVTELSVRYHLTISVQRNGTARSRPVRVRINRPDLTVLARGSFID